jgi:hypothetical protein
LVNPLYSYNHSNYKYFNKFLLKTKKFAKMGHVSSPAALCMLGMPLFRNFNPCAWSLGTD